MMTFKLFGCLTPGRKARERECELVHITEAIWVFYIWVVEESVCWVLTEAI
jgi:hypothetical protein